MTQPASSSAQKQFKIECSACVCCHQASECKPSSVYTTLYTRWFFGKSRWWRATSRTINIFFFCSSLLLLPSSSSSPSSVCLHRYLVALFCHCSDSSRCQPSTARFCRRIVIVVAERRQSDLKRFLLSRCAFVLLTTTTTPITFLWLGFSQRKCLSSQTKRRTETKTIPHTHTQTPLCVCVSSFLLWVSVCVYVCVSLSVFAFALRLFLVSIWSMWHNDCAERTTISMLSSAVRRVESIMDEPNQRRIDERERKKTNKIKTRP